MTGRVPILLALCCAQFAAGTARAQERSRFVVGGTVGFSNVTQKTTADTAQLSGTVIGLDAAVRFWRAELRGRYLQGGMELDGGGQSTDLVEGELMLGVWPVEKLALRFGRRARSYVTPSGTVRWLYWEARARFETDLNSDGSLWSYVEGWYALSGSVSSAADAFGNGVGLEGGVALLIPSTPLRVRLSYRMDQGTLNEDIRTESVEELLLTVGIGR